MRKTPRVPLQTRRFSGLRGAKQRRARRVSLERLEDRCLLAAFIVNSLVDAPDANPGDGIAADSAGRTTLRAAVMESNALMGADTVELGAGTYTLTVGGTGEDAAASGDLDITGPLTLVGAGSDRTVIDAGGDTGLGDRIFEVLGGTLESPIAVEIHGVKLTGGRALSTSFPDNRGGAMRIGFHGHVRLTDNTFIDNRAPATAGSSIYGLGGAIDSNGVLTIEDSHFENNFASNSGGAVRTSGNVGTNASGQYLVKLDITNTTFHNNSARSGGAISSGNPLTIEGSTFSNNSAPGQGGALEIGGSIFSGLSLINSTLSGNSSAVGGAISQWLDADSTYHTMTVKSSTIVNNQGGGIRGAFNGLAPTIGNSIIAGNTSTATGPDVYRAVFSLGNNLIGDATGSEGFNDLSDLMGTSANPIDPLLAPLADNGGPTWTHALLAGSPAFDAGDSTRAPATDQRGVPRPQGVAADIGAFEVEGNRPPVASAFVATIDEDGSLQAQLIATDADGDPLRFAIGDRPLHGAATIRSDGWLRYIADFDYYGSDSFTYTVSDDRGGTDTGVIEITINPVNDAPYVANPQFTSGEDQLLSATITFMEAEAEPVVFDLVTGPAHGTATLGVPPAPGFGLAQLPFTYQPAADFHGTDSFTFRAVDDKGAAREGTVTITVTPVNDPPVARDDQLRVRGNESLTLSMPRVSRLQMDSAPGDFVGAGLTWDFTTDNATFVGERHFDQGVSIHVNGSTFWDAEFAAPFAAELTPGHYTGAMRFPFQDADKPGLSVSGAGRGNNTLVGEFTVYEVDFGAADANGELITSFAASFVQQGLAVDGSANPPLRGKIQFNTAVGTGGGVLVNDDDVDGDFITAILVEGPSHGALTLGHDGTLLYTPQAGFSGTDRFTYRTSDGRLESELATVTITVDAAQTIVVDQSGGTTAVAENGSVSQETDSFQVTLGAPPLSEVVIQVGSSDTGEATVSPERLVFNSANWNLPQTVTVQGVNDNADDGDRGVTVTLAVDDAVSDDAFDATPDALVAVQVHNVPIAPEVTAPVGDRQPAQPTLIFSNVAGASSYNLWLVDLETGTKADDQYAIAPDAGGTTSYTLTVPLDDGPYRAFISANNAHGFSDWDFVDFTVGSRLAVPTAPTGLSADLSANPPTINWTPTADASYYNVWMVRLSDSAAYAAQVTTASYSPGVALQAGGYRVFVNAVNSSGTSGWSTAYDFFVGTSTPPVAPEAFTLGGDPLSVQWQPAGDATYYDAWLVRLSDGQHVATPRLTAASLDVSQLEPNRYRIFVSAGNAAGSSPWSTPFDFDIGSPVVAPAKPTGLTALNTATPRPTLQWDPSAGATGYAIWALNLATGAVVASATDLAAPSFTPATDWADGQYRYFVRAHNLAGSSGWAGPRDFTVTAAPLVPSLQTTASLTRTDDRVASSSRDRQPNRATAAQGPASGQNLDRCFIPADRHAAAAVGDGATAASGQTLVAARAGARSAASGRLPAEAVDAAIRSAFAAQTDG